MALGFLPLLENGIVYVYMSLCVFQGVDAHGSSLPVCMCALCGVCWGCLHIFLFCICVCVEHFYVCVRVRMLMCMLVGLPVCAHLHVFKTVLKVAR